MIKLSLIQEIHELKTQGGSIRRVARLLKLNRRTVKKYWDVGPQPIAPKCSSRKRARKLDAHSQKVKELYIKHRNCDVVRQELEKLGIDTPALRTIQAFVQPLKRNLELEEKKAAKARNRIETAPGEYMQIDFGVVTVMLSGVPTKVHLFVATLAYSRRVFAFGSLRETQEDWLMGIERAFRHFDGVPQFLVCDNAKALVTTPARQGQRECALNDRFLNFCRHWNVRAVACHSYYPESKGKVERMVGYVKHNGIAGHEFESLEALNRHLGWWMENVSDVRQMDLPEDQECIPINRFAEERKHLQGVRGRSFFAVREEFRTINAKGLLTIDERSYQLPLVYAKLQVRVLVTETELQVFHQQSLLITLSKTDGEMKHTKVQPVGVGELPAFGATDRRDWRSSFVTSGTSYFSNPLQAPLASYDAITGFGGMEVNYVD